MEKDKANPKRGAFPTPKNVLDEATPYEPRPAQADEPDSPPDSTEPSDSSGHGTGATVMSDSEVGMGTPGTPPPPSSKTAGGAQSGDGSTMGTPGTPPPPSSKTAGGAQSGDGSTKGTPGTPPPPSGDASGGEQSGSGDMGKPGTPPPPSGR